MNFSSSICMRISCGVWLIYQIQMSSFCSCACFYAWSAGTGGYSSMHWFCRQWNTMRLPSLFTLWKKNLTQNCDLLRVESMKNPKQTDASPIQRGPGLGFKPRSFTARLRCQPLSYATIRITKTISLPLKTILWVTWRACMSVGNRCCTRCQLRGEY